MRIALWLHLLSVVVWVGGMFFAHVALRPAVQALEPPVRLALLAATLGAFFKWVVAAVGILLVTGFFMIAAMGGFASVGPYVHVMTALGLAMAAIFGYILAAPFPRVRAAVAAQIWADAAAPMIRIRRLVEVNLVLGLITLTVAILGHSVV